MIINAKTFYVVNGAWMQIYQTLIGHFEELTKYNRGTDEAIITKDIL